VKNKGIPVINSYGNQRGDEIINISVYIPETLSKDEKKAIDIVAGGDNIKPSNSIKEKIFSHFRAYFKK
jgi:molecular chaperone DnaJ